MVKSSRRMFLGSTAAAAAGTLSFGNNDAFGAASSEYTSPLMEGIKRENIKITDVRVTPLSWRHPENDLWRTAKYIIWKVDACIIEIFTDKGIVGIGSGNGSNELYVDYILKYIKPAIIGKNPFDVEFLAGCVDDGYWGAWAGIDVAMWDIIGKEKNIPVYKLLAKNCKPDPHIRIYASGGVEYTWYDRGDGKPYGGDALIEEALRYKEEGYTAFKFRPGTDWETAGMTLDKYFPIMRRLRDAVGYDFDLMFELRPWTLEESIEIAHVMEDLKYLWFEEPMVIRADVKAIEDNLKLKEHMPTVMLSGGEGWRNRFEARPWLYRNVIDICQTDSCRTGLTENWYIAQIANVYEKISIPHSWYGGLTTMSNAALVAAIPNRFMLELHQPYSPFKEEIFKDPLVVKNGYMDVHNKPGFGMEVIPGAEKKFPYIPGGHSRPNPRVKQR